MQYPMRPKTHLVADNTDDLALLDHVAYHKPERRPVAKLAAATQRSSWQSVDERGKLTFARPAILHRELSLGLSWFATLTPMDLSTRCGQ
jgi:hypothetical protein